MKDKLFKFLKSLYKKLPVNYKLKNKLKGVFYRVFGFLFKNTTSYRVYMASTAKPKRNDVIKPDAGKIEKYSCDKSVAVQLHLFYIDLAEEFADYLNNIPFAFDLLVSITDKTQEEYVKEIFSKVKNVKNVYVKAVINRGRDVAPLLCAFGKELSSYDFFCHVHSKKSLFTGGEQTGWRKYLLDGLFGSEERVKTNLYLLDKGEKVGLVYPETFAGMPYYGHTWLSNRESRNELLERIQVPYTGTKTYFDYPLGTMFWARTEALKQFFEAELKTEEFPKEGGQTDGTIAHAFERCLGYVCNYNEYNILIYDENEQSYAYNFGLKNMGQYYVKSHEGLKAELKDYDVVSFDIFDTLISRKMADHSAIFKLAELRAFKIWDCKKSESIYEQRILAETELRRNFPDKDPDIDDVYERLGKLTGIGREELRVLKECELSVEYELACPKSEMINSLKYAKHTLGKKVYLLSDMQLRRADIEKMLEKCGVTSEDYDEFMLSSELNIRKDNKTMWERFVAENEGKKCIHIGDNEVSDVQIPDRMGIANYHVMCNKALMELTNIGKNFGYTTCETASDSVALGLVTNKLFSNPFEYNKSCFNVKVCDAETFGYAFFGPVVTSYLVWLVNEAERLGSERILFFAREGHVFKKAYEAMASEYAKYTLKADAGAGNVNGENVGLPSAEYLYVSRRALTMASIGNEELLGVPLDIYYEGKLSDLLYGRYGVAAKDSDKANDEGIVVIPEIPDEDIKLHDNKAKVLRFLEPYKQRIIEKSNKERESYLAYLNKALSGVSADSSVICADIGYSGTIQQYLSSLAGRGFDGRYMATDDKKKPLSVPGNSIVGYFIDGDAEQEISKSYIHRYHLLLEAVFIAPDGQLVRISETGEPVFEEKQNPLYDEVIEQIHEGIADYAKDYAEIMKEALFAELPSKEISEQLIKALVVSDAAVENIEKSLVVDDKYCSGEVRSCLNYYRKRNL